MSIVYPCPLLTAAIPSYAMRKKKNAMNSDSENTLRLAKRAGVACFVLSVGSAASAVIVALTTEKEVLAGVLGLYLLAAALFGISFISAGYILITIWRKKRNAQ